MISDKREQKRTITIEINSLGYKNNIDDLADAIIKDMEIVLYQRNLEGFEIKAWII